MNFKRGLTESSEAFNLQNPNHRLQCLAGIARTSIRCGDSRKGVEIALENDSSYK